MQRTDGGQQSCFACDVAREGQDNIINQPISTRTQAIIQIVPAKSLHVQPHAGLGAGVFSLTGETFGRPFVHLETLRCHIIQGGTSRIMTELVLALEINFEAAGKIEFQDA